MKAAVIREFGSPDVLEFTNVPTPEPKPGNVLVKILAAGVNRFEHYIREGSVVPELPFPHILGADAAGEVAVIGEGVTEFAVGDRVIPLTGYPLKGEDADIYPISAAPSYNVIGLGSPGTYAQYLEVPRRWLIKDDTGLTPEEAAILPMGATTSVRALKVVGEVSAGDRVLITAGSSGVGTFQIQVAKTLGATVAVTVRSDDKADALRELGANLVINTARENLVDRVREWTGGQGADVAVDNAGGDLLSPVIDATRPQGIIVAVGFLAGTEVTFDIRNFFFTQKQLRGSLAGDISDMRWALAQVRDRKIRPQLDRAIPLREAGNAHRLIAENKLIGSLVLLPWAA